MIEKKCIKCGEVKPVSKFYKLFTSKDGFRPRCKECESKRKVFKEKQCAFCKSHFTPIKTLQKYCSANCRELRRRELYPRKIRLTKKESISKRPGIKICIHCAKEYSPYTSLDKFCSMECRIEHQKSKRKFNWTKEQTEKRIGKNNPAYRNGNFARGVKKTAIGEREFIKVRTNLKAEMINNKGFIYCEHCGISGSMKFESHHLIFRSEKPLHKNLHDKINIIILCIGCHNVFHKNKSVRNTIVEKRNLSKLFGNDILNK